MDGKQLYKLKNLTKDLSYMCNITKNRIIEKMCHYEHEECKLLGMYLKKLMVNESLSNYLGTCCCEDDYISDLALREMMVKCKELGQVCQSLSFLSQSEKNYLRCSKIMKKCMNVSNMVYSHRNNNNNKLFMRKSRIKSRTMPRSSGSRTKKARR